MPDQRQQDLTAISDTLQLKILRELTYSLNKATDLTSYLKQSLEKVVDFLRMDIAAIYLVIEKHKLKRIHATGYPVKYSEHMRITETKQHPFWDDVSRGEVIYYYEGGELGEIILKALNKLGIRSGVGIPLIFHGDIKGFMNIGTQNVLESTDRDTEFFEAIGNLLGMGIELLSDKDSK